MDIALPVTLHWCNSSTDHFRIARLHLHLYPRGALLGHWASSAITTLLLVFAYVYVLPKYAYLHLSWKYIVLILLSGLALPPALVETIKIVTNKATCPTHRGEQTAVITADAIQYQGMTTTWHRYLYVAESPEYFVLYRSHHDFEAIPKRAFPNGESLDAFRDIVWNHLVWVDMEQPNLENSYERSAKATN